MTVKELCEKLKEHIKMGRADWIVKRVNYDDGHEYATEDFILDLREDIREVEIS